MYKIVLFLNIFFSETAWAIFTRFHEAFCRKNVDNLVIWFRAIEQDGVMPRTKKFLRLNIDIQHQGLKVYQVCSHDNRWLTFNLFTARSNLRPYISIRGKVEKSFYPNVLKTNGWNLQCMIRIVKHLVSIKFLGLFSYNQIFGLYTCIKLLFLNIFFSETAWAWQVFS